jgi:hypothetical protein
MVSRRYHLPYMKEVIPNLSSLRWMPKEPNVFPKAMRPYATVAYLVKAMALYVHGLYHKFAGAKRI